MTAAILIGTATFAFWPREPELRNPERPGASGALIWGDGVFSSATELKSWLEARGVNYKRWARKHPEAVELLVAKPGTVPVRGKPSRPTGATQPAAQAAKKPGAAKPEVREVAPTARTFAPADDDNTWLVIALVGLLVALGAGVAASVPTLGSPSRATGLGVGIMLSSMCIGIGFAAAALLS